MDLVARAKSGERFALQMARYLLDELTYLKGLEAKPVEDTATLKRVRQSSKHQVWRLSHGFDPDMAVRLICWFNPLGSDVVVTLFFGDKAQMGDVFYDSVGSRSDQIIDQWMREHAGGEV